jgi:hypothetical protein
MEASFFIPIENTNSFDNELLPPHKRPGPVLPTSLAADRIAA